MRIIVIGLGHIGIVTAAALLRDGHIVVGVDTDDDIRGSLTRGVSPVFRIDRLWQRARPHPHRRQ